MSEANAQKVTVYTLCTPRYFDRAAALMESIAKHCPAWSRVVFVVGYPKGKDWPSEMPAECRRVEDIYQGNFGTVAFQYNAFELLCYCKYVAGLNLMQYASGKIIYLDADIIVYHGAKKIETTLDQHAALICPHITTPYPEDGGWPNTELLTLNGCYNMGFFAWNNSGEGNRWIIYMEGYLRQRCYALPWQGMFADQKIADITVPLFEVTIARQRGWNVASWNLHDRPLSFSDGDWECAGEPLAFFHYSGVKMGAEERLFQGEFNLSRRSSTPKEVEQLVRDYRKCCEKWKSCLPQQSDSYHTFTDGSPIAPRLRRQYGASLKWHEKISEPFSSKQLREKSYWMQNLDKLQQVVLDWLLKIKRRF